jgi:hypothetical protein
MLAFPAASNFRNCWSLVTMPKPLPSHFNAQARGWESGLAATFLEQLTQSI